MIIGRARGSGKLFAGPFVDTSRAPPYDSRVPEDLMRFYVAAVGFLCLTAPLASQQEIQSKDGRLGVVEAQNGPKVRDDRGQSNPLRLAEEVRISSLVSMRSGWVAAGDRPVGQRRDLYFRMLDAGGLKQLPAPPGQVHSVRRSPVALSDGKSLHGVLWLEGDGPRSLSVRASDWLGITWGGPVAISVPGPGTQTALDAALLDDGSVLAVWSAFDGRDDEIMWSLGMDGGWTEPSPLSANSVPDIVPTVVASETGAIVSWNEFDSDADEYRVVTSQWVEGRWTEPRAEVGGTLYPELYLLEQRPTLLFLDLSDGRSVWRIQELHPETAEVVRASAVEGEQSRPLLLQGDSGAYLEWTGSGVRRPVPWEER
jgi:hypothetical protein